MSEKKDNEVPSAALFFSKRAKFTLKVSNEEFKAASELLTKKTSNEAEPTPAKKSKRKVPSSKLRTSPRKPVEIVLDSKVDNPSSPTVSLSAAAKRRLKKLQTERDLELRRIEDANQRVLSALNSSTISEVEEIDVNSFDKLNVLTISYLSEVSRLKCYEHEKFSTILPKVADLFKLKASEFLLCLRDQNIKVEDTPKSLNIIDSDVLECIPYKADENTEVEYEEDQLKIMFQSSDSKQKTEMLVHKLEKMQDVMEKYCKIRDIPLDQLIFEFDGERISGTETPEDMDMESGNCIDVIDNSN